MTAALNPQPLPPRHSEPAAVATLSTKPGSSLLSHGGCPTCTSGVFLLFEQAIKGQAIEVTVSGA